MAGGRSPAAGDVPGGGGPRARPLEAAAASGIPVGGRPRARALEAAAAGAVPGVEPRARALQAASAGGSGIRAMEAAGLAARRPGEGKGAGHGAPFSSGESPEAAEKETQPFIFSLRDGTAGNYRVFRPTQRSGIRVWSNFHFPLPKSGVLRESLRAGYPFGSDFSFEVVNPAVESQPNTPYVP